MISKLRKMFIVAEIGINHNGNFLLAKELIKKAKYAGADAVKFQTYITNNLYNKKYTEKKVIRYMRKFELKNYEYFKLKKFCKKLNIEFFSSPFDVNSAVFLNSLKIKKFKIASSNIRNKKLIEKIKSFKKEIILSSGYADLKSLKKISRNFKKNKLSILYCVSHYPAPMDIINLNEIHNIKKVIKKVKVGYSDHTKGIGIAIASKFYGAEILEKHLKLHKNHKCPDKNVSISPDQFKEMVSTIRAIENFKTSFSQKKKRGEIGIYYNKNLKKGQKLKLEYLDFKRPSIKFSHDKLSKIIGKKLNTNVLRDNPIQEKNF